MKRLYLVLLSLALAACMPPDGTTLGDSFATDIAPPPGNILVVTMSGDKWYCQDINTEKRVASDCIDRNKVEHLSELHLGPNDTWGKIE